MPGASSYSVEPGETLVLVWQAADGTETLYPQTKIYNRSGGRSFSKKELTEPITEVVR